MLISNIKKTTLSFSILGLFLFPYATNAQQASDHVSPEDHMPLQENLQKTAKGEKWLIATANQKATDAGANILRKGGNAIDAMVSVQAMLGLTEPQSSGLGGGSFLVYWDNKKKQLITFDGRETAPSGISPKAFLNDAGRPMQFFDAVVSGLSVGVPGTPRLLHDVHKRYGKMPWKNLFEESINLAKNGFSVSERLAGLIENRHDILSRFEKSRKYFLDKNSTPLKTGKLRKNAAYAKTLMALRDKGADAIYKGEIAQEIVHEVQNKGRQHGTLSLSDLANYKVIERKAVCSTYRDHKICGMGPPSSGAISVGQILGLMEPFDLRKLGPNKTESLQLIGDATRLAFADRRLYIADEDFLPVPTKGLLTKEYLNNRSKFLKTGQKLQTVKAGTPPFDHALNYIEGFSHERPSTTHFVIHDEEGNIVSYTSSIEGAFGSTLMAGGFLLNNQLTDFSFVTHDKGKTVANIAAPGKRPRSSMAPTIVLKDDKPVLALGSPGGSRIIPYVAKTIIALIDWEINLKDAIKMPHFTNRFGTFALEANTTIVEHQPALEKMGYDTVLIPMTSGIQALLLNNGVIEGAADERREGTVLAE